MSDHKQRVHDRQDLQLTNSNLNVMKCCQRNLRGEPSDILFSHFSSLIAVGFYLTGLATILQ